MIELDMCQVKVLKNIYLAYKKQERILESAGHLAKANGDLFDVHVLGGKVYIGNNHISSIQSVDNIEELHEKGLLVNPRHNHYEISAQGVHIMELYKKDKSVIQKPKPKAKEKKKPVAFMDDAKPIKELLRAFEEQMTPIELKESLKSPEEQKQARLPSVVTGMKRKKPKRKKKEAKTEVKAKVGRKALTPAERRAKRVLTDEQIKFRNSLLGKLWQDL